MGVVGRRRTVGAVVVVIALGGCPGPSPAPAPTPTDGPLIAYILAAQGGYDAGAEAALDLRVQERTAECMAEAGYPDIAEPSQAITVVVMASEDVSGPPGEGGDTAVLLEGADLGPLAELERGMAVADVDCREQTRYEAIRAQVRNAVEQEFVDDHRAELDAWIEQYFS